MYDLSSLTLDQLVNLVRLAGARPGRMAPWQELNYFNAPIVTYTTLAGGSTPVQIAGNAPNRVGLIIASYNGASVSPDPEMTTTTGIPITSTSPAVYIREAEWGNLATIAWYGLSNVGGKVTTIEVILREWPGGR